MNARLATAAVLLIAASVSSVAAPVLMISIDGLKPEYVLEADARGLKLPYLKHLVAEGSYAEGVVGVWPTVTYPSHTTLVTGVTPAEHGILTNIEFDPQHHFKESWYWYAQQIKVPTLWQAVHAKGLTTSSIGWPVTVGATDIDYLIPEYWRLTAATEDLNPSDRDLIAALSRPEGLLTELRDTAGLYLQGNDTSQQADAVKTRFAIEIIKRRHPYFLTLHLSSMDSAEHAHGVFSDEAERDLEALDGMLAQLAAASLAADPATIVAVVSDHGFTAVHTEVNLAIPFIRAGLIDVTADPGSNAATITGWRAQPWMAGGMAAIMLHDAHDRTTEEAVGKLLRGLAADPRNGIAAIADRTRIKDVGAFPDAAFLVVFKPGYYAGAKMTGELLSGIPGTHGSHGFSPQFPEMRAALFVSGVGIAHHRALGIVDMRQIAPTVAQLLAVPLPTAKAHPLNLAP